MAKSLKFLILMDLLVFLLPLNLRPQDFNDVLKIISDLNFGAHQEPSILSLPWFELLERVNFLRIVD